METEPSPIKSSPYQSPMYNYGSSIIVMTDPKDVLYEMELFFRGLAQSEDKILNVSDPLMNNAGIAAVMGMTRGIVNKITIMGNLDKNEVSIWMEYAAETLAKVLMVNRIQYLMTTNSRRLVYFKTLSTIYMCLKRPFNEGDRRFWGKAYQEIKSVVDTGRDNRPIWQKAFGIKGG